MCEKPMAKTAEDARRMVAAAKESGKKLTIGYQHRHKPETQYLKQVIDSGELGDIYYAKALAIRRRGTPNWGVFLNEYEQGGGPLIDIGTHSLDLTLYLMNNYKPRMVVGTSYKKCENAECGNPWGGWDPKQHTICLLYTSVLTTASFMEHSGEVITKRISELVLVESLFISVMLRGGGAYQTALARSNEALVENKL